MHPVSLPSTLQEEHYVVAIGASAGGLEAIHEFFDHMPVTGQMSFVIIQHLSPDYKSLLVELVAKHTNMQVFEAQDNTLLQKNCIYVIPNNKLLRLKEGRLQLSNKQVSKVPNTAIDTFLHSLAEDQGAKAIAVILSGTGTDGTRGIEAIRQSGGMVLVQDPLSARFDGMPNSAIAAGYADFILSPELMPEEIFNYIKEKPTKKLVDGDLDEKSLPEILHLIEKNCGFDFTNYKTPTLVRRIARRMNQIDKRKLEDYLMYLREAPDECTQLGKEFLIGVTRFFRDKAAFDSLSNEVLPNIMKSKKEGDVIKVWVAACSTGQEAYSLAIAINEQIRRSSKTLELKIFATDIDIDSIEYASKGLYPDTITEEMDSELIKRYFIKQGNQVSVVPDLRKQIVFARHNILKDPPFIKNDLITCRNMLIYMNSILQRKVLATLYYSLNTNGYLFLGPSEIPSSISSSLSEVDSKWKIFRKFSNEKSFLHTQFDASQQLSGKNREVRSALKGDNSTGNDLLNDFKNVLTDEFHFAAIYVDKNHEIKDAVGDFRHYLFLPEKIISLNVLKMVEPDLAIALNTAIRKAKKEGKKITLPHVRIKHAQTERFINLYVKPSAHKDGYMIIVFGESTASQPKSITDFSAQNVESVSYITELEEELKETRINLQMAVESLETTNEELQSSNEELLSANEELQSSNEELQSLNEELHTLNTEHQLRIKELVELNDDLNNYFRSTEIGQVFIDKQLRIRKFNRAAVNMINLIETDMGRPLDHISNNIQGDHLLRDIHKVLQNQQVVEREVKLSNGQATLMRILPYLRQDKLADGAVITFINITHIKELNEMIRGVFNASHSAIMALKSRRTKNDVIADFTLLTGNHAADRFLDQTDYLDRALSEVYPPFYRNGLFEKLAAVVHSDQPLHNEVLLPVNEEEHWFELIATKMEDGLVLTLTDINEKKQIEERLKKNYHELIRTKENLKVLNTSLEEKVAERTRKLAESEERFRLIAGITSDVVWDWNLVTNEIWWSESFYKLFGFTESNPAITSKEFWTHHIHPEDKDRVYSGIHEAINKGSAWSAHYRFRKQDGNYAMIEDKGSVITDEFGIPYRMVGAMADTTHIELTEKKLKEKNDELYGLIQEFKFVTDFMPQMVWATLPNGYHDFFNKQWYDYTGLHFEQTKDKGWALVLHPDDYERTWTTWENSLKTGVTYEIEYRLRRKDGQYRWFLARAIPLRDDGRIIKWFGTCTDIHDQKMMSDVLEQKISERTRELIKTNMELEVTNTELMQFASVASHDLKEPLRKIHMFSNIIKDSYLHENSHGAADYLNRIIKSSARMTKLINDLLSYSRLSVTSFFEPVDLNTIVNEVLSDLELSILEKEAIIEVDTLPEIEAIPGQMRQVFQNLIGNSLKFTRPGTPPHIRITSRLMDHSENERQCCEVKLSDNGIGFDEQYAAKIFTLFQRLHSREKYDGTGIGLAITKKIIEKHNGSINASSIENKGSTFIIILPLQQVIPSN